MCLRMIMGSLPPAPPTGDLEARRTSGQIVRLA
jgi:hypothetical protein